MASGSRTLLHLMAAGCANIQFTKAPNVLRGMGLTHLNKNDSAKKEMAKKGMALDRDGLP
jgi:hypothetical protein